MSFRKLMNKIKVYSNITYYNKNIDFYVQMLKQNKYFSFSRFGDGEWNAIFNVPGENCDGHEYFPQLGERLRYALNRNPKYYCGLQPLAIKNMGNKIVNYIKDNKLSMRWYNADVFHRAHNEAKLFPLIEQLRKMNVVIIGPSFLKDMSNDIFKIKHFVEIPIKNCFLDINRIKEEIFDYGKTKENQLYGFSASMATNVIIDEFDSSLCKNNWLIDFGSLWDMYVGVFSRGKYSKSKYDYLMKKNRGE